MIYTFYSYKGGVGRSMALVNVAELMYQAGLNVLMIDWDLEAPGLERYFAGYIDINHALQSKGVIDMLMDYKQKLLDFQPKEGHSFFPIYDIKKYMIDIHPQQANRSGRLSLLPSGRRSGPHFTDYANRVITFDWKEFYENWEGENYFNWLYQEVTTFADVVLIDSRTGVTEMGGVCTYQLADVIVLICAANDQNIQGTLKMIKKFSDKRLTQDRNGNALKTIVVPSRIEATSELTILNEFRKTFSDKFSDYLPMELKGIENLFEKLEIRYVPLYAFRELIAVVQDRESKRRSPELEEAYGMILKTLATVAPIDSAIRGKITILRINANFSVDDLLSQGTCVVLVNGQAVATAWLIGEEGYLLTAGHVFEENNSDDQIEVLFTGDNLRRVTLIEQKVEQNKGIDFALLKMTDSPKDRYPLPISLTRSVTGKFRTRGYADTLQAQSSAVGEMIGVIDRQNSLKYRLFRLRSPELSDAGYSGAPIFSDNLQAVIGIQIEAGRSRIGLSSYTILAMPLYRIAEQSPLIERLVMQPALGKTGVKEEFQEVVDQNIQITNRSQPIFDKEQIDNQLAQATCAVLIDGEVAGTAWLFTHEGHLLTASFVLGEERPRENVQVRFLDDTPRQARRIMWVFNEETGMYFSILKLNYLPSGRFPLPISLPKSVHGLCRLHGYGITLAEQWGGAGDFVGNLYRKNSSDNHLFLIRSQETAEEGFGGCAVFSLELGSVVGIQTEAGKTRIGPGRDLVLALPLYRIAEKWKPLYQLVEDRKDG